MLRITWQHLPHTGLQSTSLLLVQQTEDIIIHRGNIVVSLNKSQEFGLLKQQKNITLQKGKEPKFCILEVDFLNNSWDRHS